MKNNHIDTYVCLTLRALSVISYYLSADFGQIFPRSAKTDKFSCTGN